MLRAAVDGINLPIDVKNAVAECISKHWDFVHSPIRAAGYLLDPEFLNDTQPLSEEVPRLLQHSASILSCRYAVASTSRSKSMRSWQTQPVIKKQASMQLNLRTCHAQ
jgi:hypothetical protein